MERKDVRYWLRSTLSPAMPRGQGRTDAMTLIISIVPNKSENFQLNQYLLRAIWQHVCEGSRVAYKFWTIPKNQPTVSQMTVIVERKAKRKAQFMTNWDSLN